MKDILTPELINQPKGRLIVHHQAHMAGAVQDLRSEVIKFYGSEVLVPNADGSPFCDDYDVQRNGIFDPDDCVTCAHQNAIYGVLKWKYGEYVKLSRRYTALKSGTQPGYGNSNWNVELSIMSDDMVAETDCPSINGTTTEAQFYSRLDPALDLKKAFLKYFDIKFIPLWVDGNGKALPNDIAYAMSVSPWLVVSVDGRYGFNNQGYVVRSGPEDSHDVVLTKQVAVENNFNKILDSENAHGFVPFAADYEFHYPVLTLVKKKFQPMLYKLKDKTMPDGTVVHNPAIYVKAWNKPLLRSFSDGKIPGADMLKDLYGISDYGQLQINHVDVLPYPVDEVKYTTL